jgi:segregation and condensation protein A
MFNFKLDKFEGPLNLLLKLIEKEELDITQISLAKIADQYISYIKNLAVSDPEHMADFLLVAAKLILIKSKALLPYLYPEEDKEIEDFENQLKLYKEFLEASKKIYLLLSRKKFMFGREFNRKAILSSINAFSPPKNLNKELLRDVMDEFLERRKVPDELEEATIEHSINIEDKIMHIETLLVNRFNMTFNSIISQAENNTEIIVTFLAILELMRMRKVVLEQETIFGEITITAHSN